MWSKHLLVVRLQAGDCTEAEGDAAEAEHEMHDEDGVQRHEQPVASATLSADTPVNQALDNDEALPANSADAVSGVEPASAEIIEDGAKLETRQDDASGEESEGTDSVQ